MPRKRSSKSVRQRKKARRKSRGAFLFRILFFLVLIFAGILAFSVFFKISNVRISGETRYSDAELLETVNIKQGDNMFFINKFSIINRLFEKYVYLDEIRIRRRLPDTIEISVTECVPVVAAIEEGKYNLLDKKGKILEKTTQDKAGSLPLVKGLALKDAQPGQNIYQIKGDKAQPLFTLITELQENKILEKVNFINMDKLYDVRVGYDKRFDIYLGSLNDIERKIRFLLSVVKRLSPSDKGIIDLTDEQKAYFRPEETLSEPLEVLPKATGQKAA